MSVNISNKKYAILEQPRVKNQDIVVTTNGNYYHDDGYTGLGTVRVQIPEPVYEEVTISPMITAQTIYPDEGYDGITKITVNPVTSAIDTNIKPENIVKGITILGVNGNFEYLFDTVTITPKITKQVINPTHDGFSTITVLPVTSEIDSDIKPSNIKQGITILGVSGEIIPSNETTMDITSNGLYTPPSPYTGFSEVNVLVKTIQEPLTIEPSTAIQRFTASDDYRGFSPVVVNPVTSDIDSDIIPTNIRKGVNILGINGSIDFEEITVEPSILQQVLIPVTDGYSKVTVNPVTASIDSDIKADNIRNGITILGVTGSVIELKGQTRTIEPSLTTQTYTPSSGYNGFTSVTINAVTAAIDNDIAPANIRKGINILGVDGDIDFEEITITPSTSQRIYTPTTDGFSKVTVEEVTNSIDSNIKAENIKLGTSILGVSGSVIELKGQSKYVTANGIYTPDSGYNGLTSVEIDVDNVFNTNLVVEPSTSNQMYTVEEPYTGYNNVEVHAVTSSIDSNILAENIKEGIEILGIEGTVIELSGQTKTVNPAITTQTYTPDNGYNGFTSVTVNAVTSSIDSDIKAENILNGIEILGVTGNVIELHGQTKIVSLKKTGTTTVTPDSGYNGITSISISPTNKTLDITPTAAIQTFTVPNNYSGYGTIKVEATPLQSKTITVNATTDTIVNVTPDSTYVGLSSVKFDMTWVEEQLQALNAGDSSTSTINLQNKTVQSAGTYTCDDGYDGLGVVTVNLDWVAQAIEQAKEGTPTGDCDGLIDNTAIEIVTDADYVRQYAFYKSTNLKRVFLNNASGIQQYAFADSGLQDLIINTDTMCALQPHAFDNAPLSNIFVPSNLVASYQADSEWSAYSSIIQAIS